MLQAGLQGAQLAQVVVHRHHRGVALVAQRGHGDDLHAGGLGGLHRGDHGLAVEQRCRLAEQVQHAHARRRD